MSRKSPTLAEAVAAGTKITLSPIFVANVAAIRSAGVEAWARSEWRAAATWHRKVQDPRGDGRGYLGASSWQAARRTQGRAWERMTRSLELADLVALVPEEDRQAAWALVSERVSAARQCVAPEETAA